MTQRKSIAIIGRSCRLPGAASVEGLWQMLGEGRCAVSRVPEDRWSLAHYSHPRAQERGKSYTWSAGVLDDIWSFDPGVFGISPREAEQMDPQQRLLLELTWEALEDAGLRPSAVAGSHIGVFVGASSLDYGNLRVLDPASSDAYGATGNTLSIISNRISYIFDLKGPSFTLDTACSSSLVALNAAVAAIEAGQVDTAVVAGVNMLASPFNFISFSNAQMLSRTGLCQAFSANADGYVRAEGGVVLVLQSAQAAARDGSLVRGVIAASGVNSDGRTTGISLPSGYAQGALLEQVYREAGIDLDAISFVEAHGTGTPVGDPIEASAIGGKLGKGRAAPLPIGSIKTNIGHTEPVSGLAGLLKASLALEHDLLPASLHSAELNPDIPFEALNLVVNRAPLKLERGASERFAGVNSFGFGGTNAHVVLTDAAPVPAASGAATAPEMLLLSAQSRAALTELALDYADRLDGARPDEAGRVMAATAHRRERLSTRLAVPLTPETDVASALRDFAEGEETEAVVAGTAVERSADIAFVYSGNGSQWAGMGREAYCANPTFRAAFARIDGLFEGFSGWSLKEALFAEDLDERLSLTRVSQPLIFAIQSASTTALRARGLNPTYVLGHSVGEIAAAEAAGILSLEQAVRVIFFRSKHQESTRGFGSMAVLLGPVEEMETFLEDFPTLDIAAYNSPKALTVAGPVDAIEEAMTVLARKRRRGKKLDLEYPFHGRLMDPTERPLLRDLDGLTPSAGHTAMVSTVTGKVLDGTTFDAGYWWRNIREPVRFCDALQEATRQGARVFVEVGPRATLLPHIGDAMEPLGIEVASLGVMHRKPAGADPIARAVAAAIVVGAAVDEAKVFGENPAGPVSLPLYPWQRRAFRLADTAESVGALSPRLYHPLAGARVSADGLEWHGHVDPETVPGLEDHNIEGQVILPGAAFVEMALHVAREALRSETVVLADLEIQAPMVFAEDSLREVAVRLSGSGNQIQVLSRPRLTQAPWQIHASAKIVEGAFPAPSRRDVALPAGHAVAGEDLYRRASQAGLGFGPSFRQVAASARLDDTRIVSELLPADADPRYGLVPARLDACFHGLILLFAELLGEDSIKAYVPVRFGEVRLLRPGAPIHRALIETRRCNERSILADFTLLDADGEVIATIREGRFQALRARSGSDLAAYAISQRTELATEPTAIPLERQPSIAESVRPAAEAARAPDEAQLGPGHLLLEGWATALAYRLAAGLAPISRVDLHDTRLPEALRPWLINALYALEGSGLAEHEADAWTLRADVTLPDPDEIMRWVAADHPELSAELVLMADVTALVGRLLDGGLDAAPTLSQAALDAFTMRGATARASADAVARIAQGARSRLPTDRALRLLQVGFGPLAAQVAAFAETIQAQISLFEPDRRRAERARLALPARVQVVEGIEALPQAGFDVILASDVLHRSDRAVAGGLAASLAAGGLFVAVEPGASLFRDLVFGLTPDWFEDSAGMPLSRLDDVTGWQRRLSATGLVRVTADRAVSDNGDDLLLLAEAPVRSTPHHGQSFAFVIGSDDEFGAETASSLATLLIGSGVHVSIILDSEQSLLELERETPDTVVFLAGAFAKGQETGGEAAARLRERCLSLKRCADYLGSRQTRLWVVAPGATRDRGGHDGSVEAGVWAFSRTLANEAANLDVRRVDLAPDASSKHAAERLRDLVLSGTTETEIVLDEDATRVVRFSPGQAVSRGGTEAAPAARLARSNTGGLNEMAWGPAERVAPKRGEVEIAVEATGLNFRDVLWALSMLPEEILEDGFAGPRLGLEVAGKVVAVGPGVTDFRVGEPVVAFAQSGFSTHIVVPEAVVAPMPEGLAPAAAATVPVAFLTAYYGLLTCARLRKGEWVLVHGGAGGVGLAALQIAKWRGARVIATAGSREKRALVKAMGAEHVLDSRSLAFVDDVRRITGKGVDVVLNSLFGEMMERSLNVMAPFGRFVELGKRDYVANTHIGLRPFRRNLSYFGVDLDQVLQHQGEDGARMFREVMALFGEGGLKPLPYQPFTADEVSDAFRLMQQSGHVGKIVVTPPAPGSVPKTQARPFAVSETGVHLITGGLGGFGIEAARWLADRGARRIVLVGRSGKPSDEGAAVIEELRARGVSVEAQACDITKRMAVDALIAGIEKTGQKLAGIIHGAMVLQDGLIANLDADALQAVIRPKVIGAQHLDAATRKRALDYFVLFSSATTFIGNPGQGAYVAANGFMEGMARQRRRLGLPALAVAWGAIGDVGVLARNRAVMETLAGRVGVTPMDARHCLDLMADALSGQGAGSDEAVIAIASMHWGKARERLATMRSPSYGELGSDHQAETGAAAAIHIGALLKSQDIDEVRKTVADAIVEDIARILRLPKDDIGRTRQLSEIGLDSLMGVELGASLQERFALDAPPSGVSSGLTVNELAETLIQSVSAPVDETAGLDMTLALKHAAPGVDAATLAPFQDLVEQNSLVIKEILP